MSAFVEDHRLLISQLTFLTSSRGNFIKTECPLQWMMCFAFLFFPCKFDRCSAHRRNWQIDYSIARTLVLCNSYWGIMDKIFMYVRPCTIKWRVQVQKNCCKISVEFCASSFCLSFGSVNIILNNPNPTSSFSLLPGKDVYFNLSILNFFVHIFFLSIFFVWLRFHYNWIEEVNFLNFSLPVL